MMMAVLTVFSAKGGCGASLIATNLALALAHSAPTVLLDLHGQEGTDDLLLDLRSPHAWPELLPVAAELTERHIELVGSRHPEGLVMLAAPSSGIDLAPAQGTQSLLEALARRYAWVIVDAPSGAWTPAAAVLSETLLLVTTADPPSLRCAKRLLGTRPQGVHGRTGLVLNQFGRGQPASASEVAASLDTPLMAAIPVDPRGVGYQVNFGRPCALDRQSPLGRTVVALARRLTAGGIRKTETSAVAATPSRPERPG
jgi:pilus assembly protein CpaE